ncbi:hypothetical protein THAOC_34612 [Thalassiosira oceanica]|uniref:Uncharacterized protein n=1 Tax=Thalassiosira oceanica TaxID=159749 RepID=K0RCE7_THAOC|nr:hypothetical protein THAOC_34612 [Thalassiosira oceanica]|eukprot:EJK46706.1 hypothetical protein THAOC_34612 [Thalassiosira oceanica]
MDTDSEFEDGSAADMDAPEDDTGTSGYDEDAGEPFTTATSTTTVTTGSTSTPRRTNSTLLQNFRLYERKRRRGGQLVELIITGK